MTSIIDTKHEYVWPYFLLTDIWIKFITFYSMFVCYFAWLVGRLVGHWLVGWLVGHWLVGWLVGWLLVDWLAGWLVGWLVGWLCQF